jgi:hypothetical protein
MDAIRSSEWLSARDILTSRHCDGRDTSHPGTGSDVPTTQITGWDRGCMGRMNLDQKGAVIERVIVNPVGKGSRIFNPRRLQIV